MKEKELYIEFKQQELVYFVEKDDDSFGPVVSGSQLSKNYLDDFFEKRKSLELSLRNQIVNGEISPIYYYMLLQELAPADLAARVGITVRKLNKHFKPLYFSKLNLEILSRYAEVFNIPMVNFLTIMIIKEDDRNNIEIEHQQGENEYFTVTKISKK